MSNEKQETIADIVAEMRRIKCLTFWADRIEEAMRHQFRDAAKMSKKVDLYNKTFRKICECLNKDIEVSKTVHKVDGSSTFFISDCGALPIIFEISKIIKDTVKKDEE